MNMAELLKLTEMKSRLIQKHLMLRYSGLEELAYTQEPQMEKILLCTVRVRVNGSKKEVLIMNWLLH